MSSLINWDVLSDLLMSGRMPEPDVWDKFATRYNGFAHLETEFTKFQIEAMDLSASDTVLDVGAGPGRITVPTARKVKSVTALDGSLPMLEVLQRNVKEAHLDNVSVLHLPWEDAVVGENLPLYDVVIASRSPGIRDLHKLNAAARKYVYVMLFSGPSLKEFYDELVEGIEDPPKHNGRARPAMLKGSLSGHALVFNRLCEMGIDASVQYVPDGFTRWYKTAEEAYQDLQWLVIPPERQSRFRENVNRYLFPEQGGYRLLKTTKTVIVWWKKCSCEAPHTQEMV